MVSKKQLKNQIRFLKLIKSRTKSVEKKQRLQEKIDKLIQEINKATE